MVGERCEGQFFPVRRPPFPVGDMNLPSLSPLNSTMQVQLLQIALNLAGHRYFRESISVPIGTNTS